MRTNSQHKDPTKVLSELNRASSILRDVFNESFTSIVTNDDALFEEINDYLMKSILKNNLF